MFPCWQLSSRKEPPSLPVSPCGKLAPTTVPHISATLLRDKPGPEPSRGTIRGPLVNSSCGKLVEWNVVPGYGTTSPFLTQLPGVISQNDTPHSSAALWLYPALEEVRW